MAWETLDGTVICFYPFDGKRAVHPEYSGQFTLSISTENPEIAGSAAHATGLQLFVGA
ncbi:MAG TPA: hypothetical protein VEC06_11765 [Paucimonas sp.]|nr:hypothetical protein [Paucimonas sp.]